MAEPNPKRSRADCSQKMDAEKLSLLDPQTIRRAILSNVNEPIVFRNFLKGKWKCLEWDAEKWGEVLGEDELMFRIGMRVQEHQRLKSPQWETESLKGAMRFTDFLNWVKGQKTCKTECDKEVNCKSHWAYFDYFYMKDLKHPDKLEGFIDWSLFGFTDKGVADSTLWIGSTGANTPCHIDTYGCNLVAQIVGKKRWVLFSKSESEYLSSTRVPYEESSIYSEVGFPRPDIGSHPRLTSTNPRVITLEPGDVLFVPNQWWHSVENMEFAISVNIWLELPSDNEERVKEAIVMHQIGSLCQGIESVDLIASAFNPNMMNVATMTSADLLNLLVDKVFQNTNLANEQKAESQKKEGAVQTDYFDWRNKDWCLRHNIYKIKKLSFEEYYVNVIGENLAVKETELHETGKLYNPTENEIQFDQLKLLMDAFTDSRVIDLVKKILDEKMHNLI